MKKRLLSLFMVALMVCLMFPYAASAGSSGGFQYIDNGDGTCTITGGSLVRNLVIPDTLDGLTVTRIASYAFDGIDIDLEWIESVTIPGSVTSIGDFAFRANQISSISIPDNVFYIGTSAFSNNEIINVDLGSGLQYIGRNAFDGNNIASITLPDTMTYLGIYAFVDNPMTSFTLPGAGVWIDGSGETHQGGDMIFDLNTNYQQNNPKPVVSITSSPTFCNSDGEPHPIKFAIDQPGKVTVRIKQKSAIVSTVIINKLYGSAGTYTVYWDPKDGYGKAVPSGVYSIFVTCTNWTGLTGYKYKALTYIDDLNPTITSGAVYAKTSNNRHLISFHTKFNCRVTVRICDANKHTVRNIVYKASSSKGGHRLYWDGKDNNGNIVKSGKYFIYVIEYDENGNYWYSRKALQYSLIKVPTLSSNSVYTKTGGNRHLIRHTISEDGRVTVAIKNSDKKTIRYIEYKKEFAEGKHNVYWDGKNSSGNVVSSGVYYIYVIRYDNNKNYYTTKKLFVNISKYPKIYSNSYFTRTGTNQHLIKVDIAVPAKVSTCVKDADLHTVRYLEYKASHSDGRFYIYWDGKDKNGSDVDDGAYYIYAIKYKADGSYCWTRKKITLN